ncbi:MAG: TlpA family protein disulfide reductase, partial [Anaerolineae bacterium]
MASVSPTWTRNRYLLSSLAVLGMLLAAWWLFSPGAPAVPTAEPGAVGVVTGGFAERGKAAPGFALATLEGGRQSLQGLSGRPVLINF